MIKIQRKYESTVIKELPGFYQKQMSDCDTKIDVYEPEYNRIPLIFKFIQPDTFINNQF